MRHSSNRPARAKSAARAAHPAPSHPAAQPPPTPSRLDWSDPAAVRVWLRDVRDQARDACAAGLDATAPLSDRDLGPRAARRIIGEASSKLDALFTAAAELMGDERAAPRDMAARSGGSRA